MSKTIKYLLQLYFGGMFLLTGIQQIIFNNTCYWESHGHLCLYSVERVSVDEYQSIRPLSYLLCPKVGHGKYGGCKSMEESSFGFLAVVIINCVLGIILLSGLLFSFPRFKKLKK